MPVPVEIGVDPRVGIASDEARPAVPASVHGVVPPVGPGPSHAVPGRFLAVRLADDGVVAQEYDKINN